MSFRFYHIGLFCIFILAIQGCGRIMDNSVNGFTTHYFNISFTLNPIEAGYQTLDKKTLNIDLNNYILSEAGNEANLKSITLKQAEIVANNGATFDDFSDIKVTLSAPGQPEKIVAETTLIPAGTSSLTLDTRSGDLSGYLCADRYTIKTVGVLKADLKQKMPIITRLKYNIKVGV